MNIVHCSVSAQHEYTTYMDKKIKKQQTMIITQHDRNMKDLEDNARDEAEMLARYDKQKGGMYATIHMQLI